MEESKNSELGKKVDEAWKDTVKKEKSADETTAPKEIQVNFELFLSGLMMEGMIAIGDLENPVTKKKEANVVHAKFLIDTLDMLKEKTKNNLLKNEEEMLEAMLYELKMRFVAKAKAKQ